LFCARSNASTDGFVFPCLTSYSASEAWRETHEVLAIWFTETGGGNHLPKLLSAYNYLRPSSEQKVSGEKGVRAEEKESDVVLQSLELNGRV